MNGEKRESLGSSLGFLLVSAGCAVGLGNVWRFPFIVGENGGALFVLIYILFLVIFGLPMMVAEFSLGRASQTSVVHSYSTLVPKAKRWDALGRVQVGANWLLMMYYTTIAGWLLAYPVALLSGWFKFSDLIATEDKIAAGEKIAEYSVQFFGNFVSNPAAQIFWMAVVCLIGFSICALGLKKGVEDITKKMMTALFIILIGLCVYVMTLDGASEGIKFYLMPSTKILETKSLWSVIYDALGQSFFTLSLGIGSMAIFGSYTSKKYTLPGESAKIIVIDTIVALLAGMVIFPACFAYNTTPDAGPSLIFMTLPKVFAKMPGGIFIGSAFFVFLGLAALTTVITVFETILSGSMERTGCTRHAAIKRNAPLLLLLALPCALGFNVLSFITPFGPGSGILDFEDFLVSNIALPLGSLCILIFCVSKRYWGWNNFIKEANTGSGLKLSSGKIMRFYMTFVLPTIMVLVFVMAMIPTAKKLIAMIAG